MNTTKDLPNTHRRSTAETAMNPIGHTFPVIHIHLGGNSEHKRLVTLRHQVHLGIHTATTSPCLATVGTFHRLVTLSKDVHPGIHTAMTSWCLVTRQKSQRSVTLGRLATLRKHVHPGIDTATTSPC